MAPVAVMVALGIAVVVLVFGCIIAAIHGAVTSQHHRIVIPPMNPPRFPY